MGMVGKVKIYTKSRFNLWLKRLLVVYEIKLNLV